MNTARSKAAAAALALLAAVTLNLAWRSASAQIPSALISRPVTSLLVPIAGTVGGIGETVVLSGRARVTATVVPDPDFGGPTGVVLAIHLLEVSGVGQLSGAKYAATGEHRVIRLLAASDLVEVTFPVFAAGARGTALARPLLASFNLSFDPGNGQMRKATANFSAPGFLGSRPGL